MNDRPTVVQFSSRRPPEGPLPNEDVLQILAELIPLAQSGEIQSIAVACVSADDTWTTYAHDGDAAPLLGSVQVLSTELALTMLQEDE